MNALHAIILGIVEGLSEFLPISSTAHLDFARQLLGLVETDFIKSFEIIIQLGAILAVLVLYFKTIFKNLKLSAGKLAVAFAPTAVVGLLLYKIIKQYFLGNTWLMITMLVLGGIGIIFFEKFSHYAKASRDKLQHAADKNEEALKVISYKQAFLIGCAQSVAVIPGTSRSAATIIGGLALGIPRSAIVEFSFLLAIPTMAAATGLDLIKSGHNFTGQQIEMLAIGFIVSFLVALAVIKWFMNYIRKHNFTPFAYYRIIAGLLLAIYFWYR